MRNIEYFGKQYRLIIDGEEYPLKFCIGIYRELGINDLGEMPAYLTKAGGVFKAALTLFNENIKKYNKEYNGNEKPIRYKELVEITDDTEKLYRLGSFIKNIYIVSQVDCAKAAAEVQTQAGIRPTVNRLAALGSSAVGLSYSEIMSMSLKELYEIIDAYNDLMSQKKEDDEDYNNEGIHNKAEIRLGVG